MMAWFPPFAPVGRPNVPNYVQAAAEDNRALQEKAKQDWGRKKDVIKELASTGMAVAGMATGNPLLAGAGISGMAKGANPAQTGSPGGDALSAALARNQYTGRYGRPTTSYSPDELMMLGIGRR